MSNTNPPSPPTLDYGRGGHRFRWQRWMTITVLALVGANLILVGWRKLDSYLARRAGLAAVIAWYQDARTRVMPSGTLLSSERHSDFADSWPHAPEGATVMFERDWPSLRVVEYVGRDAVPTLIRVRVVYSHEHRWRMPPTVTKEGGPSVDTAPSVICIRSEGHDYDGRPEFWYVAYRLPQPTDSYTLPSASGRVHFTQEPSRPLTNLRIYASRADPVDLTRFTLPFDCDGGRGRFEFKTDDDATDGGKLAPDVWIEWDDEHATNPTATRPSTDATSPNQ